MKDSKLKFDLEEKTYEFARSTREYVKSLPKNITNHKYSDQLVRSSGSVGANYIEANESLGKKDLLLRLRISKKEAKESRFWLRLTEPEADAMITKEGLIRESLFGFVSILGFR